MEQLLAQAELVSVANPEFSCLNTCCFDVTCNSRSLHEIEESIVPLYHILAHLEQTQPVGDIYIGKVLRLCASSDFGFGHATNMQWICAAVRAF